MTQEQLINNPKLKEAVKFGITAYTEAVFSESKKMGNQVEISYFNKRYSTAMEIMASVRGVELMAAVVKAFANLLTLGNKFTTPIVESDLSLDILDLKQLVFDKLHGLTIPVDEHQINVLGASPEDVTSLNGVFNSYCLFTFEEYPGNYNAVYVIVNSEGDYWNGTDFSTGDLATTYPAIDPKPTDIPEGGTVVRINGFHKKSYYDLINFFKPTA